MKKIFILNENQFKTISKNNFDKNLLKIGKELSVDFSKIPFEAFKKGVKVEMEHGSKNPKTNVTGDNLVITAKIALAHLEEMIDYYDKLENLEQY